MTNKVGQSSNQILYIRKWESQFMQSILQYIRNEVLGLLFKTQYVTIIKKKQTARFIFGGFFNTENKFCDSRLTTKEETNFMKV